MLRGVLNTYMTLMLTIFLAACGDEEEGSEGATTTTQGWHFQGRDCLACHNVDLTDERHLLIGGTVFKSASIANKDDLTQVCGGEIVVKLLDSNGVIAVSSQDNDQNSKGYKGKGNLFFLARSIGSIAAGAYTVMIFDANNTLVASSNALSHQFTSDPYDINNAKNYANRIACNSCHNTTGGDVAPIYANINPSACK